MPQQYIKPEKNYVQIFLTNIHENYSTFLERIDIHKNADKNSSFHQREIFHACHSSNHFNIVKELLYYIDTFKKVLDYTPDEIQHIKDLYLIPFGEVHTVDYTAVKQLSNNIMILSDHCGHWTRYPNMMLSFNRYELLKPRLSNLQFQYIYFLIQINKEHLIKDIKNINDFFLRVPKTRMEFTIALTKILERWSEVKHFFNYDTEQEGILSGLIKQDHHKIFNTVMRNNDFNDFNDMKIELGIKFL